MELGLQNGIQNGIKMQIQKKRRKNDYNGMWGSTINIFGGNNSGFNNNNNGWGNNGWGNQNDQWNNNNGGLGVLQNSVFSLMRNRDQWGNNLDGFAWVQQQLKRQDFKILNVEQKTSMFDVNNMKQFLQKQVIFLEPSPAQQRLQQLSRQGLKFTDDRFPPNNTSLCGQYRNVSEWASINWRKINDIMPTSEIFRGKVQPNDIKQGYLGDCYFLAGLAALAERPDRIFNLFLLKQKNPVSYFSVKMLYKGKWLTIDMDQFIPCLNNKPAFSKANQNQLWVILLEKAWAKLYSSYKRIQAGYPQQPLHDLTGAPIKQILTANLTGAAKQSQWNYLMMASQKQYAMVASSRPGSDRNQSQSGIVQGHAYTFLNATVLHYHGGSQRIVQLRNPWGKGQNKGRWSDNDQNWSLVPIAEQQRIGFAKNFDDGTFFMTYDAFISQFRCLTVAQINDNASYIYRSVTDRTMEGAYFKIQIVQHGYYSFHIDKTPQRSFEDRIQDQYQYPVAILQLARVNGNFCQKLQSFSSPRRTLFRGYTLEPGVYVAYTKIKFDARFQKQYDINLAIYAEYVCDIQVAPRQLVVMFTGNPNVRWNPSQHIKRQSTWNNLGNSTYRNSGNAFQNGQNMNNWGNQGMNNGQQNQNGNNNWGNQPMNNGWEMQNNYNGWGNEQQNNGWGNQPQNNQWANQIPSNNGWGDQTSNNGWNNQMVNNNNGWGDQVSNNGWGNQMPTNNYNNNGWGNQ